MKSSPADIVEVEITRQSEVRMPDVIVPVFIPYARFLEVRARRLAIDTDITPADEHPTTGFFRANRER